MEKFFIRDEDKPREARSICDAIEEHVRDHEGEWSDYFEVYARREGETRWSVFAVQTHTEFVVEVGGAKQGPVVESDEAAQ